MNHDAFKHSRRTRLLNAWIQALTFVLGRMASKVSRQRQISDNPIPT